MASKRRCVGEVDSRKGVQSLLHDWQDRFLHQICANNFPGFLGEYLRNGFCASRQVVSSLAPERNVLHQMRVTTFTDCHGRYDDVLLAHASNQAFKICRMGITVGQQNDVLGARINFAQHSVDNTKCRVNIGLAACLNPANLRFGLSL